MFLMLEQVTGRNRNLHVRIQLIDDGEGILKLEYVGTGL